MSDPVKPVVSGRIVCECASFYAPGPSDPGAGADDPKRWFSSKGGHHVEFDPQTQTLHIFRKGPNGIVATRHETVAHCSTAIYFGLDHGEPEPLPLSAHYPPKKETPAAAPPVVLAPAPAKPARIPDARDLLLEGTRGRHVAAPRAAVVDLDPPLATTPPVEDFPIDSAEPPPEYSADKPAASVPEMIKAAAAKVKAK